MESAHQIALDQALAWIESNFQTTGIIISGSIIRGNPNVNSDFDIFVIHTGTFRQRLQKFFNGVPCEIFINTLEQTYKYFQSDLQNNRPITAHIIGTGNVVTGATNPQIIKLVEDAKKYMIISPPVTDKQILFDKYALANFFEDATDVYDTDKATMVYILDKVVKETVDYLFLLNQQPLPRIKERLKVLLGIDQDNGKLILDYYTETDANKKYELAKQLVLAVTGHTGFFEWESQRIKVWPVIFASPLSAHKLLVLNVAYAPVFCVRLR